MNRLPICSVCKEEKHIVYVDSDGKNYCKNCKLILQGNNDVRAR